MPQSRFHAMDATRAFALLLGVVFHAAWSFCPVPIGAPVVDASASTPFYWFFLTSHTFRMQLFFLIAGFFAHLLYHRRGAWGFAHNRLLRVGLPLVVGWFLLAPLIIATWTLGANAGARGDKLQQWSPRRGNGKSVSAFGAKEGVASSRDFLQSPA
jgi:glucans biosynthesis protein C